MLITAGLCLLAAVLLGLLRQRPAVFELRLRDDLSRALDGQSELLRWLVLPSEPVVLLPAVALIAGVCALQRRWPDAALAVAGPAVAVGLNSWVLKPLFGWLSDDRLAYPSGHTASLVAVATVLGLLARDGLATWVAGALGVLLTAAAGVGMTVLGFHYPADILGGAFVGVGVVFGLSLVRTAGVRLPRAG